MKSKDFWEELDELFNINWIKVVAIISCITGFLLANLCFEYYKSKLKTLNNDTYKNTNNNILVSDDGKFIITKVPNGYIYWSNYREFCVFVPEKGGE